MSYSNEHYMNPLRSEVVEYVRTRMVQGPALMERMAKGGSKAQPSRPRQAFAEMMRHLDLYFDGGDEHMFLLSGIRGAGKSTIMAQVYRELLDRGFHANRMVYVSMDEAMFSLGAGVGEIFQAVQEIVPEDFISLPKRDAVLILDEVQYDKKWSLALKTIYDRTPDLLILGTGSSALHLREQGDLARRGQFMELTPLGLEEYLDISGIRSFDGTRDDSLASALFGSSDAVECHSRLLEVARPGSGMDVSHGILARYLTQGSMPLVFRSETPYELNQKYIQLLEKVIFIDMPELFSFDRETSLKISQMVYLLADSDLISYEKIGATLSLSKGTISTAIHGLEQAGIIIPLRDRGGQYARSRSPPRYKFTAPSMRCAILDRMGKSIGSPETYGKLLEDAVIERIGEMVHNGDLLEMWYEGGKNDVDLMVRSKDGKQIRIEIGWGHKDSGQMHKEGTKNVTKYDLVVSATNLQQGQGTVFIPREYLLQARFARKNA
jgi:predicted AAA+ superfamily ATPase